MRIYKRGGWWWADFGIRDGRRLRRSAETRDRDEAEAWARATQVDLWRREKLGERPRVTWDTAVLAWLAEKSHKKSIETDKLRLRWLSKRLAGRPLDAINRDVVEELITEASKTEGVESGSTVNRYTAALSQILHFAHEREWLAAVPKIRKLPEPKKRVRYLSRTEASRLLAELPEHLRAMAAFTLATGLRQGNVSYLEWSQVDVPRRAAWIHADQAKGGDALPVPLNDDALAVLRGRRKGKLRHRRWVFTFRGEPVAKTSTRAWSEALKRARIKNFRWHDLRHTWASWHAMNETPREVLQELGGWKSDAMVQRYAHLSPSHLAKWAGNVAEKKRPAATKAAQSAKMAQPKKTIKAS